MLSWFQFLMPKEEKFFSFFNEQARTLVKGAEALRALLDGGDSMAEETRRLMAFEEEADGITREVMLAVRRTFITPFDRADIRDLISLMDDAIDQMQKTAKAIALFEVHDFQSEMKGMGDIIVQAANITVDMIGYLSALNANSARINVLAEKITRIEEQADQLYDSGRKALFLAHRTNDPMAYIVGIEIYDHLEKVVDRFEDVANRVSSIVIEHV